MSDSSAHGLIFLLKHLRLLVAGILMGGLLGLCYGLLLPPRFEAHFSILGKDIRGFSLPGGADEHLLEETPQSYFVALLSGETLRLEWIRANRLLQEDFFWGGPANVERTYAQALQRCEQVLRVEEPSPLVAKPVTVTIRTDSPALSKRLAESLLTLLIQRVHRDAERRHSFFNSRLKVSLEQVEASDEALHEFAIQRGYFVPPEMRLQAEYNAMMDLRLKETTVQAELDAIRQEADEGGGAIDRQIYLRAQQSAWGAKLRRLGGERSRLTASLLVTPEAQRDYRKLRRQLEINERISQVIYEQETIAQLRDEAFQELPPFRVIDRPYEPDEPIRRYLLLRAGLGGLVGLLTGLLVAGFHHYRMLLRQAWREGQA